MILSSIFAIVSAVAFLASVSQATIFLYIIIFELACKLEYFILYIVTILVAK